MITRPWRLADALEWGSEHLEKQGIESSRFEAQLLLSHVLNRKQDYPYLNSEELLSADSLASFRNLVERRKERIPWQYLTGRMEFMSLDFVVNEKVMIPRPETEILVEAALKKVQILKLKVESCDSDKSRFLPSDSHLCTIIDVGTGCGNIAIALARALPCQVYALDISKTALQVARVNAERLDVNGSITFLQEDILALRGPEDLAGTKGNAVPGMRSVLRDLEGKVDLVISNPPYVANRELGQLQPEVSCFEPRIALDGGEDGLKFYLPLIERAAIFLRQGGYLALEMGMNQAEAVKKLIVERDQFNHPEVIKDYSGIERVITAQKLFASAPVKSLRIQGLRI